MGSSRVGSNPTRSVFSHNRIMRFSTKFPEQPPRLAVPANLSCDGRVVKAFDSKSNGIFPRRFESYSQRWPFAILNLFFDSKFSALSGNRTPVSRVAGENSTTEPTMLKVHHFSICANLYTWNKIYIFEKTDHDGDRTHNLPIRSRTPYPLGHAADAKV